MQEPVSEGRAIHQKVNEMREKGDSWEALKLSVDALVAYQKAGDILGMAEILTDNSIAYRHIADKEADPNFLIVSKCFAKAGVEMARKSNQKEALPIPLSRLGAVQAALGEYQDAAASYREAVEEMTKNPPAQHNRPAVLLDMKINLAATEYLTGDKAGLERAENALKELEGMSDTPYMDDYTQHVWVSGGHMKLAEILKEDNPELAKQHLEEAKKIIDNDPKLTIRKSQWEKLSQSFE